MYLTFFQIMILTSEKFNINSKWYDFYSFSFIISISSDNWTYWLTSNKNAYDFRQGLDVEMNTHIHFRPLPSLSFVRSWTN